MVEVFKTNVSGVVKARRLTTEIQSVFTSYKVNFDLDDCDRILRVETHTSHIEVRYLIDLLFSFGVEVEVLDDFVPSL